MASESCSTVAFSSGEWDERLERAYDGVRVIGHCEETGAAWEEYSRPLQRLANDTPAVRKYGARYQVFGTAPRSGDVNPTEVVPAQAWFCIGALFDPADDVGLRAFRDLYKVELPTFPGGGKTATDGSGVMAMSISGMRQDIIAKGRVPRAIWDQHSGTSDCGTNYRILVKLRRRDKVSPVCRSLYTGMAYVYFTQRIIILIEKKS